MTDNQLAEIEKRHVARAEHRKHMPSGEYFYDSLGFVHNDMPGPRGRVALLVRTQEWFESIDMDKGLTPRDRTVVPDVGLYAASVLSEDVEGDVLQLIAEVRRLREK